MASKALKIHPKAAAQLARARATLNRADMMRWVQSAMTPPMSQPFGGGGAAYTGASNRSSLSGWNPAYGDADAELNPSLPRLRATSQSLYINSAPARGAIKRKLAGVVGSGLTMRSTIDQRLLGLSPDEAQEWQEDAESEFRLWADSRECDYARRLSFSEIQQLAFTSQKVRGDCFIIMSYVPRTGVPYDLRLQLIEADRVSNPNDLPDDEKYSAGIERDVHGVPVAIHVRRCHPGSRYLHQDRTWDKVPIFGSKTGRRQILHLMEFERIDQSRGEPALAPVIEILHQLTEYSAAEIAAALVNAVLTVFFKRPLESVDMDAPEGAAHIYTPEERAKWENRGDDVELGTGTKIEGAPGEELQVIAANRPNAQFDPFFSACLKQIGIALGIPFEVLSLVFQSSYSASRAALLEFAKETKIGRAWLKSNLCQAVYEEFLTEAVIRGRLVAPGFLEDPIIRAAYCRAEWMGPSVGQIDPLKEAQAAVYKIQNNLSTGSKECAEISGMDFEQVVTRRMEEQKLMEKCGVLPSVAAPAGFPESRPDGDDGDTDAA